MGVRMEWHEGFPKTVKVAYRDYRIELFHHWEAVDKQRFGEHDGNQGVIRLDANLDPMKAVNTMLHELLHAVWLAFNVPDKKAVEEEVVGPVSNGLVTVFRDNPALVAWIAKTLEDRP